MNQSSTQLQRRKFFTACLLGYCLMLAQPVSAGATQWVDIEIVNGHLMVATEIAGIPGHAIIDTGASINAINGRFLKAADLSFPKGRKIEITGIFGTENHNTYRKVPVSIFGTNVDFNDMVELNVGSSDIQLLLGAGFLKLFVFQFDYPNNRMRVITRDIVNQKAINNVKTKRDRRWGSPIVKARLNDEKDVWLVMDTGNNGGVVIERSLAKKQKWLEQYATVESSVVGVNTGGRMQKFNLPSLTFGGYTILNPIITVPAEGETIALFDTVSSTGSRIGRKRSKAQGLLGYDVLKHFVVTVDFKSGRVHVEPGSILP